jgi:hypothetical protein
MRRAFTLRSQHPPYAVWAVLAQFLLQSIHMQEDRAQRVADFIRHTRPQPGQQGKNASRWASYTERRRPAISRGMASIRS